MRIFSQFTSRYVGSDPDHDYFDCDYDDLDDHHDDFDDDYDDDYDDCRQLEPGPGD